MSRDQREGGPPLWPLQFSWNGPLCPLTFTFNDTIYISHVRDNCWRDFFSTTFRCSKAVYRNSEIHFRSCQLYKLRFRFISIWMIGRNLLLIPVKCRSYFYSIFHGLLWFLCYANSDNINTLFPFHRLWRLSSMYYRTGKRNFQGSSFHLHLTVLVIKCAHW